MSEVTLGLGLGVSALFKSFALSSSSGGIGIQHVSTLPELGQFWAGCLGNGDPARGCPITVDRLGFRVWVTSPDVPSHMIML